MSVDPYMRGWMNDVKSYVPPFRRSGWAALSAGLRVVPCTAETRRAVREHDRVCVSVRVPECSISSEKPLAGRVIAPQGVRRFVRAKGGRSWQ